MSALLARREAIWVFAFAYFCAYVPYTGLTKAISSGRWPGSEGGVSGATLLPISTLAGLAVMLAFLWGTGWWRSATQLRVGGLSLPVPTRWTALSGLATALVITTTTLAYTFEGASILLMMLLMRGGVLVIAPLVDRASGRRVRASSWLALALSLVALWVATGQGRAGGLTALAALDLALYLGAYVVRLRFMSRLAKSEDPETTRRYFVEEQLMATPMTLLMLLALAAAGQGPFAEALREGFTAHWRSGLAVETALIGVFSQATGIFGTLVFLDPRENSFAVPVNRSASVLAGVAASGLLALGLGTAPPGAGELAGAGLVLLAVLALALGPRWGR